ncbi:hypothetical protein LCGC14_1069030 [marine sediment metagenome]|uniref:Uncharacterized protein n=1 Tax=marine sediment metagenome TaxID=412755 RepID=A0A0F9QPR6_9ZZZZ
MRRPCPSQRELAVLHALARLEGGDPRRDGPGFGYGLHMLRQATNTWIGRGDLTRLCNWELVSRLLGYAWAATWEGYVWLTEERIARAGR